MKSILIFVATHVFLSSWHCATAKELIGVQVSRGPNIYSGSNACALFSDNKFIYYNEIYDPKEGNALVIFIAEDKSKMSWSSLIKKFNFESVVNKLDRIDIESEEAPAGSPPYRLILFYSDKSFKSYISISNRDILSIYSFLEKNCWDAARDCIPIIKRNYSLDFFKDAIKAEPHAKKSKSSIEK